MKVNREKLRNIICKLNDLTQDEKTFLFNAIMEGVLRGDPESIKTINNESLLGTGNMSLSKSDHKHSEYAQSSHTHADLESRIQALEQASSGQA